jgi:amino acid permease
VSFIKKLQAKPKKERKIILWSIVIILALILGTLWIYSSYKNVENLKKRNIIDELNIPDFNE